MRKVTARDRSKARGQSRRGIGQNALVVKPRKMSKRAGSQAVGDVKTRVKASGGAGGKAEDGGRVRGEERGKGKGRNVRKKGVKGG